MAALASLLPTYDEQERILVLASLPSTLSLLHLFLAANAVPHSTLVSPFTSTPSSVQLAVESFEKGEFRVLCASGTGLWGGLVPRDCHVVIVDEDWSGRQTLQLENLMHKVRPKSVKRVVSKGTIEDHIFTARADWVGGEMGDTSNAGIDDFGIVGGGSDGYVLGKGLIELRGKPLAEVLNCPEPPRPSTPPAVPIDPSAATFLPSASETPDAATNLALSGQLSVLESRACILLTGDEDEDENSSGVVVMPKNIPPFSASRLDMGLMQARVYVSRFFAMSDGGAQKEIDAASAKSIGERWEDLGIGCDDR